MKRLSIAIVVLAIPLAVTHAGPAVDAATDAVRVELLAVAGAGQAALLAQNTPFDPRLQLHSSLRAGVGLTLGRHVAFLTGVGVERANPSSLEAGYAYPAWTGRTLWARVELRTPASPFGGRLTLAGTLAGYDSTYLVFFFPSLEAGPVLMVPLKDGLRITVELRLGYQIRQDLAIAVGQVLIPGAFHAGIGTELEYAAAAR